MMKGVFLDCKTLGNDISCAILKELPIDWRFYEETCEQDILEKIKNADIVVTNKVPLNTSVLRNSSQLKLICVAATGYNIIDIQTAWEQKIAVCNVPNYSTSSVAQLVMTFIFALTSNLVPYVEDVKKGKWQEQSLFCLLTYPITELKGKKLGILGYGNLGKKVALLAQACEMEVIIARHSDPSKICAGTLPFRDILALSDFLTIHLPLTPLTKNLIARKEIEQMKPSSFLINTARGGIVHEADLAACLKERKIAGAAVDVLSEEPPLSDNPLLDNSIPHLLLTPHIAWASRESRLRLVEEVKQNIEAFLNNTPRNLI